MTELAEAIDRLRRLYKSLDAGNRSNGIWADAVEVYSAMNKVCREYLRFHDTTPITRESLKSMGWWLDADDHWIPSDNSESVRAIDYGLAYEKLTIEYRNGPNGWREAAPQPRTIGELRQLIQRRG